LRRPDLSGLRCHGAEVEDLADRMTGDGATQACVLLVSGRVQGVGFRWFAEREASRRSIRGHVRNLEDGRVEILAQGRSAPLAEFRERIGRGPSSARVDRVDARAVAVDPELTVFRIRA
jgi:acylphosphatase